MRKALLLTAISEAAVGLVLLIHPSSIGRLLFGQPLTGVAEPVAGVAGIALIALAVGCWRQSAPVAMLAYSTAITLYLAYLGIAGVFTGVLLWPAVAVHVVLSISLARSLRAT